MRSGRRFNRRKFIMRVGTVILNFNNYEATLDCVRGVAAQSGTIGTEIIDHFIVIVDNGSGNDSCTKLTNALQMGECGSFSVNTE